VQLRFVIEDRDTVAGNRNDVVVVSNWHPTG